MARRGIAATLLVAAALADLPVVYAVVARGGVAPPVALAFGFLAMGLAWGAGFRIEGSRGWFVLVTAGAGALQIVAPFVPALPGDALRPWCFVSGSLAAAALGATLAE